MRTLTVLSLSILAVAASACAPSMGGNRNANETERLAAECQARGGILTPTGTATGQPAVDNACRMTNATRVPG